MKNEKFEIIAKTLQGLEDILAQEIAELGGEDIEIGKRMVSFKGDKQLLYKTNLSEECKQLTMDVNSELRKNGVSLLRFKKRINFKKYVLYKLGLLKLVFDLRLRMKRYR